MNPIRIQKLSYRIRSFFLFLSIPLSLLPASALAESKIKTIIDQTGAVLGLVITILFIGESAALLWGVIQYIVKADSPNEQNKAKAMMAWSIVGMTITAAIWGIALLLTRYFGIGGYIIPDTPGSIPR